MKVLIVRNEEGGNKEAEKFFRELGVDLVWADTLKEAAAIDHKVDMILMGLEQSDACSVGVVKFFVETARSPVVLVVSKGNEVDLCVKNNPNLVIVERSKLASQLRSALIELITLQLKSSQC